MVVEVVLCRVQSQNSSLSSCVQARAKLQHIVGSKSPIMMGKMQKRRSQFDGLWSQIQDAFHVTVGDPRSRTMARDILPLVLIDVNQNRPSVEF
jgi:hypothetical protein